MINALVVLGATGDLTGRLLLPALATLQATGALGTDFRFVGAGQQGWTDAEFSGFARDRLGAHAPQIPAAHRDALLNTLRYRSTDVTDPSSVAEVLDLVGGVGGGPVAVYLALPTQLMLDAARAVTAYRLPPGSRIAVEKPFGRDYRSAVELNTCLQRLDGSQGSSGVYRVDHALAMTAVQALHRACKPGTDQRMEWSSRRIRQVDVLWEETLALEDRAAFYDQAGALRDVMQNHLLQLLCTIAQPDDGDGEPEAPGDASARRAAVLRTIRPLDPAAVRTRTRRARYTAGPLADDGSGQHRTVPDYAIEEGVDSRRHTETFAEVVLEMDSAQWSGTRFVLRAGKALDARRRGVRVHFRPEAGSPADARGPVWFDVDGSEASHPGAIESGHGFAVDAEPAAYQRVVAELLDGGDSYGVGAEEAELGWRVFEPVLQGWADNIVALQNYPAGSAGPP